MMSSFPVSFCGWNPGTLPRGTEGMKRMQTHKVTYGESEIMGSEGEYPRSSVCLLCTVEQRNRIIPHRQTRKQGIYMRMNKQSGLANLDRSSLYRRAFLRPKPTLMAEKNTMDILCTHYQHLHVDQRKALPTLVAFPEKGYVYHIHGSRALRSLTW